jgi:hypothetical protein
MTTHQARGAICIVNGKRVDPATLGAPPTPEIPEDLDELGKGELTKLAKGLGIDVKKSWSAERLRDEIEEVRENDGDPADD